MRSYYEKTGHHYTPGPRSAQDVPGHPAQHSYPSEGLSRRATAILVALAALLVVAPNLIKGDPAHAEIPTTTSGSYAGEGVGWKTAP